MKKCFRVMVTMPPGVSIQEMAHYIEHAVGSWKGSLHPSEPLFALDRHKVYVRPFPKGFKFTKDKITADVINMRGEKVGEVPID